MLVFLIYKIFINFIFIYKYGIIYMVSKMVYNGNKIKKTSIRFLDWLIHMVGYAFILILMSVLFPKSFYINSTFFGIFGLIVAVIIYWLNQTVKPMIVLFTLPITGLTLGIFYPFINLLILYFVSFILGSNFVIHGFWIPLLISILISITNMLLDSLIIKPVLEKR